MADWRPQSQPEPQPEATLETSGGITNRKFDFRGYGAEDNVSAAPPADVTAASESVLQGVADLAPERPTEVDMPEEV